MAFYNAGAAELGRKNQAGGYAGLDGGGNLPPVFGSPATQQTDQVTRLDTCDATTGWTATNGTVTLDTTKKSKGLGSLKLTTNSGATANITKNLSNVPAPGKTFRAWVNIADITKLTQIQFLVWYGTVGPSNYYTFQLTKALGQLFNGPQIVEFHTGHASGARTVVGSPDPSAGISQIRCYVLAESGQVAEVNFDAIELVQRRPGLLFINDSPYTEFTEIVVPKLEQRGIPYTVQLPLAVITDWQATGTSSGICSLARFRDLMKRGCVAGLHSDCRSPEIDDATFQSNFRAQIAGARSLGLLRDNYMNSALQGRWESLARLDHGAAMAGMMRRGNILTDAGIINGLSFPPSSPMFSFRDVPSQEFGQAATEVSVAALVNTAVADQTMLTIFGHGVETYPGQLYRSSEAVYDAFFEELDAHIHLFDLFSPASAIAAAGRNHRSRNNLFSYTPGV